MTLTPRQGDPLNGSLLIEGLPPLPLTGPLIRHIRSRKQQHDWALQFQLGTAERELFRDWLFQRHQDAFIQEYQSD